MNTHVGVDLHQRFCYLTAVVASGRLVKQGHVVNEAEALRAWLGQVEGPRQVVVEASGFWPAFVRAAAPVSAWLAGVEAERERASRGGSVAAPGGPRERGDRRVAARFSARYKMGFSRRPFLSECCGA